MQSPYEKFQFDEILAKIASFSLTEQGKKKILSLRMEEDPKKLRTKIDELEEMRMLLSRYERLPIQVSSDLTNEIGVAKKGGCLNVEELERVANDILTGIDIKRYFSKVDSSPLLVARSERLPSLPYLEKCIHNVIAPDLSIFDNASPKLKSIRMSIKRLEMTMKKKLGDIVSINRDFLSDSSLTLKNGHYVLPVQNAYKRKVKGIVQDVSGSGETTFIEPEVIVSLNNQMMELQNEERNEIRRLLMELSSLVSTNSEDLLAINSAIGEFDFLMAKSLYCDYIKGSVAHMVDEQSIEFLDARHPLIDPSKVVANDFHLDTKNRVVVLSGPNAGGKTVALKTLGLLLLMAETALPVPAKEGAYFSYFKRIAVDIGDNQSLSDNLSTFSAHMKAISDILSSLGGKDLVLIDELGTGTSPREGEAIALSVLEYIKKKHAFALVSSHFEGLKAYALSSDGIQNASMLFDKERLLPTYRLKMGLPGESYGLPLAKRFNLPDEVIEEAKRRIEGKEDLSVSLAIEKLSEATKLNEDLKEKLSKERNELEKERIALKSKENALLIKENRFKDDLDSEKKRLLSEYEEKLKGVMDEVKKGDVKLHEVIKAKKKLEEFEDNGASTESLLAGELKEGDYVSVPSLYIEGRLTSLKGEKAVVVTSEGLSFNVKKGYVKRIPEPKEKNKNVGNMGLRIDELSKRKSVLLECNLIGMHVDEAKLALAKYVDDCVLRHYKRVRIIHGWGSGALRGVVLEFAKNNPDMVFSVESAGGEEGGGGATIFHLR